MKKTLFTALLVLIGVGVSASAVGPSHADKQTASAPSKVELESLVKHAEHEFQLPHKMLDSIVRVESSYKIAAVNPRHPGVAVASFGLGQLTVDTAHDVCGMSPSEMHDPRKNIVCAAKVLRKQLNRYRSKSNKIAWAVAAYNSGTPCVCDGEFYTKVVGGEEVTCRHKRNLEPLSCSTEEQGKFWNQDYVQKFASNFGSRSL